MKLSALLIVRVVVLVLAILSGWMWSGKIRSDVAVSRSVRLSGPYRLAELNKSRSLEANYLKTTVAWNEAIRGKGMSRRTRAMLAVDAYRAMEQLESVIPGYRGVAENMKKMRLVIRDGD